MLESDIASSTNCKLSICYLNAFIYHNVDHLELVGVFMRCLTIVQYCKCLDSPSRLINVSIAMSVNVLLVNIQITYCYLFGIDDVQIILCHLILYLYLFLIGVFVVVYL